MRQLVPLLVLIAGVALASPVRAQPGAVALGRPVAAGPAVTWEARAVPLPGRTGAYRLVLAGRIAEGWRVYAMGSPGGRPLTVALGELPTGFRLTAPPAQTGTPRTGRDDALGTAYTYFADDVEVVARVEAAGRRGRFRPVVRGTVTYAACNDSICLPPRTALFEAALGPTR